MAQFIDVRTIALPHNNYIPSISLKLADVFSVSFNVSFKFCPPIILSRLRHGSAYTSAMLMPEATVNKNYGTVFR